MTSKKELRSQAKTTFFSLPLIRSNVPIESRADRAERLLKAVEKLDAQALLGRGREVHFTPNSGGFASDRDSSTRSLFYQITKLAE